MIPDLTLTLALTPLGAAHDPQSQLRGPCHPSHNPSLDSTRALPRTLALPLTLTLTLAPTLALTLVVCLLPEAREVPAALPVYHSPFLYWAL